MFLLFGKAFYAVSKLVLPNKILFADHFKRRLLFRFITQPIFFKSHTSKHSKSECFYFCLCRWMSGFMSTWVRRTHAGVDCCLRSKCIYGFAKIFVWMCTTNTDTVRVRRENQLFFSSNVRNKLYLCTFIIFKHTINASCLRFLHLHVFYLSTIWFVCQLW